MSKLVIEIIKERLDGRIIYTAMVCQKIKLTPASVEHNPLPISAVIHINDIVVAEGLLEDMEVIYNKVFKFMQSESPSYVSIKNNKLIY